MRRPVALLLLVLALAGCGEERGGHGTAQVWITRDRGAHVLLTTTVPAGLTAMQALDRVADVKTRYGGRFVQSVNGVEGSATRQRDWFYFVNGLEADRSAADYRLRAGDVEWWDYRSWRAEMSEPVVVGAFPEPFVHGYDGKLHRNVIVAASAQDLPAARALRRVLGRAAIVGSSAPVPRGAFVLRVVDLSVTFSGSRTSHDGVVFVITARDALRLAANPRLARFRYEGLR